MMDPASFEPARARRAMRQGLASIGVGLALVAVVLWGIYNSDLGTEAIADLRGASRPGMLALSWVIISLAFYFMGLRWRALMPRENRPPGLGLAGIICAGLLLNYAVPGPFGELGAAWFAHKRYRVPLPDALATGVAARLLGLATAAVMALLVWSIVDLPPPAAQGEWLQRANQLIPVGAVAIGIGGILLFWLSLKPTWWKHLSAITFGRMTGDGRLARAAQRVHGGIASLAEALDRTARRGPQAFASTIFWSACGHCSVIAGIYMAAAGLGATPNLAGLAFTYAATTAGAVALFAFPASQVGWDLMFFSLLVAAAGLVPSVAGAIALLVRLQQLSMMLLGAVSLSWLLHVTTQRNPKP